MALRDSHKQILIQRLYNHDIIQWTHIWVLEYCPRHINRHNYITATKDTQSVPFPKQQNLNKKSLQHQVQLAYPTKHHDIQHNPPSAMTHLSEIATSWNISVAIYIGLLYSLLLTNSPFHFLLVTACIKTAQIQRCARGLFLQMIIFQWNNLTAFNPAMPSHLIFMTQATLPTDNPSYEDYDARTRLP
jgi:hypothetical protein